MLKGKQRLRYILTSAVLDIYITCDIQTLLNYLAILAVVAHFTSKKLQLTIATLALTELKGEYSGLNQVIAVNKVLNNFRIRRKLRYFVINNTISNNQLIQSIARLLNTNRITYNPKHRRLRYNRHIINLIVQAFLFSKEEDDY